MHPGNHVVRFLITIILTLIGLQSFCFAQAQRYPFYLEPTTVPDRALQVENLEIRQIKPLKVALVLSGGSARGFAHVGVLKALEEEQVPIQLIVGTSIGAIIGGFYAAGYTAEQIERRLKKTDWAGIFANQATRSQQFVSQKSLPRRHIVQLRFNGLLPTIPSSISQGQRIFQTLYNNFLQANFHAVNNFDELKIPFRAIATDLISGQKVVLRAGDLAEAINASMAFPLLFAPVEIDGRLLVDGGITDNLPVGIAMLEGAELIIASDATSPLRSREAVGAPWEIADQVTSIMMADRTELSRRAADIVIRTGQNTLPGYNMAAVDSMISEGYREGKRLADSIWIGYRKAEAARDRPDRVWKNPVSIEYRVDGNGAPASFQPALRRTDATTFGAEALMRLLEDCLNRGDVAAASARIDSLEDGLRVFVNIEQYPLIDSVAFENMPSVPDSLLHAFRERISGQRLNTRALKKAVDALRDWLTAQGLALARIGPISLDEENARRILRVAMTPGKVSAVKLEGNRRTKKFVIEREFPIKKDSLFQSAQALQGIRNIYGSGLFDRVLINLEEQDTGHEVTIKVKERQTLLMRMGAHFSLERQTDGFVEISEENLFGAATGLSITGMVGGKIRRTDIRLATPRLFHSLITAELHHWYQERQDRYYRDFERVAEYNGQRAGVRFLLGQQIERLGLISAEMKFENVVTFSADQQFRNNEDLNLRSLTIRSVVDKRDRLPFPQRGIFNRWFWEIGSQTVLGGNARFTKVFLGLEGYYPWLSWLNWHPFAYGGSADLTLPFSEFFRLGGQQSFRGLHDRELQGRQMVNVGGDLRARVSLPLETYISLRYQIGAVWERSDDRISAEDFLHSISTQLAINSPIGPARLTYSFIPDGRSRVDFSLGFDF